MPAIAFYLDENVDVRVAAGLLRRGIQVRTTADEGLLGGTDDDQLVRATALRAALVTHDPDLILLANRAVRAGRHHYGVVFAEMTLRDIGEMIRRLHLMALVLGPEDLADRLEFL